MKGGKCPRAYHTVQAALLAVFRSRLGRWLAKGSRTWSMDVCAGWDFTTYRILSFSTSNELSQMSFSLLPNWG